MLCIHTLTLGAYQTNTYIIHDENAPTCCIIDPGYEPQTILDAVRKLGLTVEAVLLTHGHFDHVGAVRSIVEATQCALWMHQSDYSHPPFLRPLYPLSGCDFAEVNFYEDDEVLCLAELTLRVLTTPGHTHGSVCLLCDDAIFSGDTLFCGSCGRTDLPGGDRKWMQWSLERLSELEGDYRIFPGHGESTTLAHEKKYNPYMG